MSSGNQPILPSGRRLAPLLGLVTFGDEAFSVSLPIALLALGASAAAPVLIHGSLYASLVVAGLVVGGLVDRMETFHVVRRSLAASALIVVTGSGLIALTGQALTVSVAMVLALGIPGALVAAAIDAGAGRTDPSRVTRLYGSIESIRTGATIAGPLLGGFVAGAGVRVVLSVYAALFALGALFARGALPPEPRRPEHDQERLGGALAEFRTNPSLVGGVALSSSLNIGLAVMVPLSLSRLKLDYGLTAPSVGLCLALVGVVSVVAAQAAGRMGGHNLALPAATTAILVALVGTADSAATLSLLVAAASAAAIFFNVRWRTYRQRVTTAWRLGAVSSWCRSIAYSWIALVSFIASWFVEQGVDLPHLQSGAGLASVAAVLAYLLWSRTRPKVEGRAPVKTDAESGPLHS